MRPDSKNRRHNLSVSDILVSSTLKLKVIEKENVTSNLALQNEISDKKSGLHKSQVIRHKNISKKDVDSLTVQSEIIAQNNKHKEENKAFENGVRHAVGLLIQKQKEDQKNFEKLKIEYQRARNLIKTLEDKNLTQKKALKIYRNELRARDILLRQ